MSRHAWSPDTATEEQLRLRQAAIDAFNEADARLEDAWALAGLAHAAGVPMEDLEAQTKRSRATLFRKAKKGNAVLWRGDNFDEIQALRPDARMNDAGDLLLDHADGTGPVVVGRNYVVHRREQDT
jgi:hypothetical protein